MKVQDAVAVETNGCVSGLFVWDDDQRDFRNVHLDELKNPLFDCVEGKDVYYALLLQQNASMRKQLDAIYRAMGVEA